MEVKDLQAKQTDVTIELDIISKGTIREFQKFGRNGRVCNVEGKDKSGKIKISLWNDQIDLVNIGDRIKIESGYVSEWQGELQLTTGRNGKIEVIGKAQEENADGDNSAEKHSTKGRKKKVAVDDSVTEEDIS